MGARNTEGFSGIARGVAEAVEDCIAVVDGLRRIIYANQSFALLTGYTRSELKGKQLHSLYRKENRAKYGSAMSAALLRKGRWAGHIGIQRRDGRTLWIAARAHALQFRTVGGPGRSSRCVLLVFKDQSSDRKRWADEYSRVMESIEDGVTVCDSHGTVRYVNSAQSRMLGMAREEITGTKAPYPWMEDSENRKLLEALKFLGKAGAVKNVLVSWKRPAAPARLVSLALAPLRDGHGRLEGSVITARDVTDVQYVDELRRAAEEVQRLMVDLGRKRRLLETLQRTNALILRSAETKSIFRAVIRGVDNLLSYDLAGVYVYNPARKILTPHTLSKQTVFSRRLAKFPLRCGEGIIGRAAAAGRMICVNNAQLDPRSRYPAGMKPPEEHFIAVPLKHRETLFGILVVARNRGPEFIEEDAGIVRLFADAVTVALENARLRSALRVEPGA